MLGHSQRVTTCNDEEALNFIKLYDAAIDKHCPSEISEDEVKRAMVSIVQSFQYDSNNRFSDIDYNEIENVCGYASRYAPLHAAFVRHLLSKGIRDCEDLRNVLISNAIKLVSVGGAAGNDMMGFCSALHENMDNTSSKFMSLTVIDSCSGWSSCFNNVIEILNGENYFGNLSELFLLAKVNVQFISADLTDSNSAIVETEKCIESIKEADIILMVKLLSILTWPQIYAITEVVMKCMKVGSLLVTIDAPQYEEVFQKNRVKDIIASSLQLNIVYRSEPEKYTLSSASKYNHLNIPTSTGSVIIYKLEKPRRKRVCPVDDNQRVEDSKKSNMAQMGEIVLNEPK